MRSRMFDMSNVTEQIFAAICRLPLPQIPALRTHSIGSRGPGLATWSIVNGSRQEQVEKATRSCSMELSQYGLIVRQRMGAEPWRLMKPVRTSRTQKKSVFAEHYEDADMAIEVWVSERADKDRKRLRSKWRWVNIILHSSLTTGDCANRVLMTRIHFRFYHTASTSSSTPRSFISPMVTLNSYSATLFLPPVSNTLDFCDSLAAIILQHTQPLLINRT